MKLLLGIDYGTGGCKVTAIGEDGSFAGEASTEFPTHHDRPGWSEQDPSDWWNALRSSLEKLAGKGVDLKSVAACALDGSTHNAVLLDGGYRPVRRTIMWTDQRATVECEALRAGWGEKVFSTCYQMPAPTWTLPQMMWLKANEPESLAKTEHVLFVKDYVRYLLTGEAVTDRIEAQGTLFFDMAKGKWDEDLVLMSGLRPDSLPRLIEPTDVAGRVTREAAAFTGLPEGTPVVCGSSDSAVEDYGAGAVEPGDLIIKLATAGNVNSMTAEAHPHPKTLTYSHIVPGMWYSVSATNAAALCMRWLRDAFYLGSDRVNLGSDRVGIGSDRVGLGSNRVGIGSNRVEVGSDRVGLESATLNDTKMTLIDSKETLNDSKMTLIDSKETLYDSKVISIVRSKIEPLLNAGCDRIVLGCTHFPHLKPVIEKVCAGRAEVIDPSEAVARQARRVLARLGLLRGESAAEPSHVFISSKPPDPQMGYGARTADML